MIEVSGSTRPKWVIRWYARNGTIRELTVTTLKLAKELLAQMPEKRNAEIWRIG